MTEAAPSLDESKLDRYLTGFLRFCKHPASILVWFCLFSLIT